MDLRKIFGRNLKFYRLLNGYTQEEFAKITDSSISYISNVENGKYGPSFDKIFIFSSKLNIEPAYLFDIKISETNMDNVKSIFKKKRDDN